MTAGKGPSVQMRLCCSRICFRSAEAEAKNSRLSELRHAGAGAVSWYPAPSLRMVTAVMELFRLRRAFKDSTARMLLGEESSSENSGSLVYSAQALLRADG